MTISAPSLEQPFFFGPASRQLFGCFHAPTGEADRNMGLVLCNPLGHEAIRAQRALRQLAIRLAWAGYAVLRFDYYATGDSAGSDEQGALPQWLDDIALASERLKRESGVPRVGLVGLRLGAALAALYGAAHRTVSCVVLWEPVIVGRAHLAELADLHQETLWRYARQPEQAAPATPTELLGFPLTTELRLALEGLDLLTLNRPPARAVLLINRQATPETEQLHERLAALGARVQRQSVEGPVIWNEDVDKALVPHATLQSIVAWLAEAAI